MNEHELEDDVLNVGEHDADALKKQTQKLPLQLRTYTAVFSAVQSETQMYLSNNIVIIINSQWRYIYMYIP